MHTTTFVNPSKELDIYIQNIKRTKTKSNKQTQPKAERKKEKKQTKQPTTIICHLLPPTQHNYQQQCPIVTHGTHRHR
jgi:hypothetical protein